MNEFRDFRKETQATGHFSNKGAFQLFEQPDGRNEQLISFSGAGPKPPHNSSEVAA